MNVLFVLTSHDKLSDTGKKTGFWLEEFAALRESGGLYSKGADWAPYVQVDGTLVTGQNPASSGPAALALLRLLQSV